MGAGGKLPAEGSLVEVQWLDAVGYIGEELENAKPAKCITFGKLVSSAKLSIVIASSLYEDGTGDFTVVPRGMLLQIRRINDV